MNPTNSGPFVPKVVPKVGYCTNVHAGRDLPAIRRNIVEYCAPIQKLVGTKEPMGVGLWFSEESAKQAIESKNLIQLKELLEENRLIPFTLNGFPQGDFHREVVKHDVYQPPWWSLDRLNYTKNLVKILHGILPAGQVGSISTLPIAWGNPSPSKDLQVQAAVNLFTLAMFLYELYERTGRKILLAIEPEPGCYLTNSKTLRDFFQRYLSPPSLSERHAACVREYLTLCHDVCHAAVMFEDQATEFQQLQSLGIAIGKVQVSSAIELDWDALDGDKKWLAVEQLKKFAEDRYLHQTTRLKTSDDGNERSVLLTEDLPQAIGEIKSVTDLTGKWRVHFHVPIYLQRFESLSTTQSEIQRCVKLLMTSGTAIPKFSGHFEIETYAWGVLPAELRESTLQRGIAKEFLWFLSLL